MILTLFNNLQSVNSVLLLLILLRGVYFILVGILGSDSATDHSKTYFNSHYSLFSTTLVFSLICVKLPICISLTVADPDRGGPQTC